MGLIDQVAPFEAAEPWDRVGLLVGDPAARASHVAVALDPTVTVVQAALARGAEVLVTHHPIYLQAIESLVAGDPVAERVTAAVRGGLSVIAAHTNVDVIPGLAIDGPARALGMSEDRQPLVRTGGRRLLKVVVFVPEAAADDVAKAMAEAGAGHIGDYADCAFMTAGTGTFRPLEGSEPFVGTVGELERVAEMRIETVVEGPRLDRVLAAMIEAHPYEEVAYDVYALERALGGGLGCAGGLATTLSLDELASRCRQVFGQDPHFPAGRPKDRPVERLAIMPGSASQAGRAAVGARTQALVCGEMKYHEAVDTQDGGVAVLAVGHARSELHIARALAAALAEAIRVRGWAMEVTEVDPGGGSG